MSFFVVALLFEVVSFVAALPSGGSGGSRGGSKGGSSGGGSSSGGSSGGSSGSGGSSSSGGSRGGSGWTSSRNNGTRTNSGPLSKGAKIALAVIGGVVVAIILLVLFLKWRERRKARKNHKHTPVPEKAASSAPSSRRSSLESATMAHNPGHTQSAVHPVSAPLTKAELTSAVMDGEGTRAGHGHEGAGDGSRGGVGPMMWEARALAVVSKGMSADPQPHHDAPSDGEKSTRTEAPASMPAPMNMPTPNPA